MVAEEVRGKGKRGLLRIIFGRTTFFILFMALQIAVLAWIYFWLDDRYQAYGYGAFGLVSAILAIRILNEKQNASFKMAWLVPVLLFPVFGCLFYIFVQLQDGDQDPGKEDRGHPDPHQVLSEPERGHRGKAHEGKPEERELKPLPFGAGGLSGL